MRGVTIEDLVRGSERRLGLVPARGPTGAGRRAEQARVQFLGADLSAEPLPGIILILSAARRNQCAHLHESGQKSLLKKWTAARIPALFFSESTQPPEFLGRSGEAGEIPLYCSVHDEFVLESRLKGLLREKIDRMVHVHGALLNILGRGVLIRGESGIGKTTLAIKLANRGHRWVADDAVIIERRGDENRLWARGCGRTRRLVDLKAMGVRKAAEWIDPGRMLEETPLHAVIEGADGGQTGLHRSWNGKKTCDILGVKLPCFPQSFLDRGEGDASRIEQTIRTLRQRESP